MLLLANQHNPDFQHQFIKFKIRCTNVIKLSDYHVKAGPSPVKEGWIDLMLGLFRPPKSEKSRLNQIAPHLVSTSMWTNRAHSTVRCMEKIGKQL